MDNRLSSLDVGDLLNHLVLVLAPVEAVSVVSFATGGSKKYQFVVELKRADAIDQGVKVLGVNIGEPISVFAFLLDGKSAPNTDSLDSKLITKGPKRRQNVARVNVTRAAGRDDRISSLRADNKVVLSLS